MIVRGKSEIMYNKGNLKRGAVGIWTTKNRKQIIMPTA